MTTIPHYDIVVIGAGIQGAGVAQAAAANGYTTLVIEKHSEAGAGTSCKSSKLIHGGLRYLESGQFKLVKECLDERKILLKNAPHLVKLIPFYIPVYSHSLRPAWLIKLGLAIYSLFSLTTFSIVKKSDYASLDGLNLKNIKTIFKYYDAQTDDKKLTQAVINSAQKLGADIYFNAHFISSNANTKKNNVIFEKNQQQNHITCKCIVNCSGPWVASTQEKIMPALRIPQIELIAGTHIVISQSIKHGIYYIEASDKRAVFIMPWKNNTTLVGTTERAYFDDVSSIMPTDDEKHYLLTTYNQYFSAQATADSIVDSFAGLRVLASSDKSTFHKSRECLIIQNTETPGQITLIGGKLTAYRASSEDVLTKIKKMIGTPKNAPFKSTKDIPL